MKKNKFTLLFFLASCLFFTTFSKIFPQNQTSAQNQMIAGKSLTDYIEDSFSKNKIQFVTQKLAPTGQDEFAENIYIEFAAKDKIENSEGQKNTAIFEFTQEDFYKNEENFLSFLNEIKSLNFKYNLIFLFSALDESSVPPFSRVFGSEVFAENFPSSDEAFSVIINFDESKKNTIYTGSFRSASPLWLCKKMAKSFSSLKESYSYPNLISSLYRLGFIHGDKRMESFVRNEIPAISVSFSSVQGGLKIIKNFAENYSPDGTEEWDMHYIFVPLQNLAKPIVLNEEVCLAACMILALITLFSLCILTFTGKQGEQNKINLLKNLYMIPLTLAVSVAGLLISQIILKKFTGNFITNPVTVFGCKIIFSMILVSIFYAFHNILKLPTDIFIYSYIIQFTALFNIFFFALQDLLLFPLFGLEYILILVFRKRKSLANLIIFFIMMTLPFMPYALEILHKTNQLDFSRLIYTNFWGNFSVSLALFPFQILWLKILIKLDIYNKQKKYPAWKLLRNGFISTASIFAFCFAAMQTIYILVFKPVKIAEEKSKILIEDDFSEFCSMKISKNEFSGMNTNHIKISSKKNALRYIVTVTSLDYKVPVYDSIYAYDFTSEKADDGNTIEKVSFIIPDYPPKEMTIDYAASPDSFAEIKVDSFYADENDKIDGKNGNKVILHEKTTALIGTKK